ncbi:MAG: hypothetical protein ACYCUI_09670 [Vulcanimicrobiaceae bacterium]
MQFDIEELRRQLAELAERVAALEATAHKDTPTGRPILKLKDSLRG